MSPASDGTQDGAASGAADNGPFGQRGWNRGDGRRFGNGPQDGGQNGRSFEGRGFGRRCGGGSPFELVDLLAIGAEQHHAGDAHAGNSQREHDDDAKNAAGDVVDHGTSLWPGYFERSRDRACRVLIGGSAAREQCSLPRMRSIRGPPAQTG